MISGTGPKTTDACAIIDNENGDALIPDKEVAIVQTDVPGDEMTLNKNISDGGHEILNQADEHINEPEEGTIKSLYFSFNNAVCCQMYSLCHMLILA